MPTDRVRITPAVARVLDLFLADLAVPLYGYRIMEETGFSGGKVYQILARLTDAGILVRHDNGPEADTGRRVTYTMKPEAVPTIRRAVADAEDRERRGVRIRVHVPSLQPDALRRLGWKVRRA